MVDSATGVLHAPAIAGYSRALGGVVRDVLEDGETPLVLGGDCSILLGGLLALRGRGRHGLLFVDGHADFYDPASESAGEAASMDLALDTGRGPGLLADLDGGGPLVRDEDVAVVGFRDHDAQREDGSPPLPSTIRALDLPAARQRGVVPIVDEALAVVARPASGCTSTPTSSTTRPSRARPRRVQAPAASSSATAKPRSPG